MSTMLSILFFTAVCSLVSSDPLDDYVNRYDPHYKWEELSRSTPVEGVTTNVLNMTSQKWKDTDVHDHPIWWHYLTIHVPDNIASVCREHAYVVASTGSNDDLPPAIGGWHQHIAWTMNMTADTNCISAVLRQCPNQPITFVGDPPEMVDRTEDSIIAKTWAIFINNTDDPEILLRFPMTKAVVRAFDTINALVARDRPGYNISKFIPAGESKRGWTTWTVMAVDKRVVGAQPSIMSAINFQQTVSQYYQALGGWSFALFNYWNHGLTQHLYSNATTEMMRHVDPFSYRDRYNFPYMMCKAASDEFFMISDSWNFWDQLPQKTKFMWILEKCGHSLGSCAERVADYWYNQATFYLAVASNYQWPEMEWTRSTNGTHGTVRLRINTTPKRITAWSALSARNSTDIWANQNDTVGNNEFSVTYAVPSQNDGPMHGRWLAFFMKVVFAGPMGRELTLTTEANVIPNTWPWPRCDQDPESNRCDGIMV